MNVCYGFGCIKTCCSHYMWYTIIIPIYFCHNFLILSFNYEVSQLMLT